MNGGATPVRDLKGHVGLVCPTEQVRNAAVVDFVGGGFELGEHVVLATGDPRWASVLEQSGLGPRASEPDHVLTTWDAPRLYPAEGQRAPVDALLGAGHRGVRVVTFAEEVIAHLGESGFRRAEREMDDVCGERPVTLLCVLGSSTAWGEPVSPALETFVATHAHQLRGPGLTVHRDGDGAHLGGEVDIGSSALVEAALSAAERDHNARDPERHDLRLVVDLSALDFLDVAGYRALLGGTERWRRQGGTVVFTGVRGMVRRLVELLRLGADGDVRLG